MWALTLLAVLQAARANSCIRITYGTDENGAKTVSKSFAITARSPEACKTTRRVRSPRRLIDFDIAQLFGFPRTRELVDRRELPGRKSYADLLTELHGEVCTANTGAAARAAAARARWNRPVT